MKKQIAKITSKGQITVPKSVRDYLNVSEGDYLEFTILDDSTVNMHPASKKIIEAEQMIDRLHTLTTELSDIEDKKYIQQMIDERFNK